MSERINWYRTPIDKDVLKELTRRRDLPGLLHAGSFLIVYAAGIYFSWFFFKREMWIPMAAVAYAHAIFTTFVGMQAAVHELSHFTPFKTRALSEFFYFLFCFLTWNNPIHFRESHFRHHQYTVHRGLDKEVILEPIALTFADYLSWFTIDFKLVKMMIFPVLAHSFGNADVDPFSWDPLFPPGDKRRKQMCNWDRLVLVSQIILLGVFIYYQQWILIATVNFGYFFATFIARWCEIQQHMGLSPNTPDWRVSCHTMIFGPFVRFLYWNMNYHIEHHMYAAVPFYNLKKLHEAIAYDTPVPPKSFWAGLRRIGKIYKQQKKEPGYIFVPEFPESAAEPRMK